MQKQRKDHSNGGLRLDASAKSAAFGRKTLEALCSRLTALLPTCPSLGHNRRGEPVDHILRIANYTSTCTRSSFASPVAYFSFAYSALARWKIGMLGSASFHSV